MRAEKIGIKRDVMREARSKRLGGNLWVLFSAEVIKVIWERGEEASDENPFERFPQGDLDSYKIWYSL